VLAVFVHYVIVADAPRKRISQVGVVQSIFYKLKGSALLTVIDVLAIAAAVPVEVGEAALVAERVLNESVVTTNWNNTVQSGLVRQGLREFKWTLHNDPWNQDQTENAMRLLWVEVTFGAQGRDYALRLSTLADSSQP